jgi:hypothetical protein
MQAMNLAMILGMTSALLLALVAGLLITVGLELRRLKPSLRGAPLLAEQLTAQVLSVKQLLTQIKHGVSSVAPQVAEAENYARICSTYVRGQSSWPKN